MAGDSDVTYKKWNVVKEQLISLCAVHVGIKGNEDLKKILDEDISLKNISSQTLTVICYFLLGIIDLNERDKLIKWPLVNIQTHTKFRKGLSSMVNSFQEKYTWANIRKLPESYFTNPHGHQKKLVDFILRLTNLAIHIVLDDPGLLVMHSGIKLNSKDIDIVRDIVSKARLKEERLTKHNVLPLEEFELNKNNVSDKCIRLREENSKLEKRINYLLKCAVKENLIHSEQDGTDGLKEMKEKKLSELNKINEELTKYHLASEELLGKLKALKHPITLMAKDFNCENSTLNLAHSTLVVCEDLHQLYQNIISTGCTQELEKQFYDLLVQAQNSLKLENDSLKSFLLKTDMCQAFCDNSAAILN
ncbi:hypothetical protein RUM44_001181 [Polyplax serrata]|uniref:HAUS augmin-like complex subunit 6 N-terminal domain-containing protein n=1 Tax=Polyplax serrata TaxID=468196 RepID=A0ABR1B7V5_POLSC